MLSIELGSGGDQAGLDPRSFLRLSDGELVSGFILDSSSRASFSNFLKWGTSRPSNMSTEMCGDNPTTNSVSFPSICSVTGCRKVSFC